MVSNYRATKLTCRLQILVSRIGRLGAIQQVSWITSASQFGVGSVHTGGEQLAKSRSARYSLPEDDKGMFENDRSAGESSGTYSIAPSPYPCVDVMVAVNCEGLNTADPQIVAGSTFTH
jgi:hypothetical protein